MRHVALRAPEDIGRQPRFKLLLHTQKTEIPSAEDPFVSKKFRTFRDQNIFCVRVCFSVFAIGFIAATPPSDHDFLHARARYSFCIGSSDRVPSGCARGPLALDFRLVPSCVQRSRAFLSYCTTRQQGETIISKKTSIHSDYSGVFAATIL